MRMYDIIEKKRDKKKLSKEEIEYFITNYTNGNIPDYQVSSLLMAIYLNGMDKEETADLTIAMANSSGKFDLSSIGKTIVDKHSTGGIGDKITLIVLPMVASLGVPVAKMSGRGLGFTGGTADKIESIENMKIDFSFDEFVNNVKKVGMCLMTQTQYVDLADKKLYALRDVTATVESIPLIASSIMSKKIASGADKIVIDVTCGSGAFMKNKNSAKKLAKAVVDIGEMAGKETVAVITNMDEPLGKMVGNSLEIKEVVDFLTSSEIKRKKEMKDLETISLEIGSYMLKLSGVEKNLTEAKKMLLQSLENGTAYKMFENFVRNQGGNVNEIKDTNLLPKAKYIKEVKSNRFGYISKIDGEKIGRSVLVLGGGREKKEDTIDYSVGIEFINKVGDKINKDETIFKIHYNDERKLIEAEKYLDGAIKISKQKTDKKDIIIDIVK